jgi:hypothetical protein
MEPGLSSPKNNFKSDCLTDLGAIMSLSYNKSKQKVSKKKPKKKAPTKS